MTYDRHVIQAFEVAKPLLTINAVEAFRLFTHTSDLPEQEARRVFNNLSADYLKTQQKPAKNSRTLYDYLLLVQNNHAMRAMFLIISLCGFALIFFVAGLILSAPVEYLGFVGAGFFILTIFCLFNFMMSG